MRSLPPALLRGPFAAAVLLAAVACRSTTMDDLPAGLELSAAPPVCEKRPHRLEAHGDVRVDDYFWLNQREDPEVLAYLAAENAFTEAIMAPTEALQEELFEELVARIQENDVTVPVNDGPFAYYTRTEEGLQYPIHCRKPAAGGAEEILFDLNAMAEGSGFFSMGARVPSPDHESIAYAVDRVGRRLYDVEIKNIRRGDTERTIRGAAGGIAWAASGRAIYYVKRDPETLRAHQVWRHTIGTQQDLDVLVFEEEDEEFSCYVTRSRSKRFLMIVSRQTLATEVRVLDAEDPDAGWRVIAPRERGHEYSVDHQGSRFLIRTNRDAENFRLVSAPVESPGDWTDLIPHRVDTLLEDVDAFRDHFDTRERRGGHVHLIVHPLGDGESFPIEFDDPAY
ncbi:MAG: oligopeptidase B, partial [Planctomycetota bacterium]|nr:oligopeptidase B [Planctomycetota bacterium]